jgi:hypothetical protein
VLSEEPFWRDRVGFVNTLRLRAAYGTTGRAPLPGAALETYSAAPYVLLPGTQRAGLLPLNPGNRDLQAERGVELEAGLDAGALDDRLGVEVTFFNKATRDLILQRPIAPSLGYAAGVAGQPFVNVGEVLNRGVEVAVRGLLVRTSNFAWEARLAGNTLKNELVSLGGVAPFTTGVNGANQYREGKPLGAYYAQSVVGYDAARKAAIVSDTTVYLGSPVPSREATASSDITLFRNLRFSGLLEYKGGNRRFNATEYFREKAFTQTERYHRRADLPEQERAELFGPYVNSKGAAVPSSVMIGDYIQDASFVRLRELSLTYSVPVSIAARIPGASSASLTLGGRNLGLWTNYRGGDPENNTYTPATGVYFVADFLTIPQSRRFFARLNIEF